MANVLTVLTVTAVGCAGGRVAHNLPPAQQLMAPGPGVGGPGPGVIPVGGQMTAPGQPRFYGPGGSTPGCGPMGGGCEGGGCEGGACGPGAYEYGQAGAPGGDIQQVQYCEDGAAAMAGPPTASQIAFIGEDGLQVNWSVSGGAVFDSAPLVVPGRQDFPQGAIYRLKLSNIPGRPQVRLYPTLEVAPVTPRTDAYLAHAPIPIQFTEEDFDQVLSGNFVTKVVYLPDPEFQELALAGVETLVSTRLDPGCDPIAEADKRGSILAIVRIGNKDLETGGQPTYEGGVLPVGHEADLAEAPAPADFESDAMVSQNEVAPTGGMMVGPPAVGMAGGPMPVGAPTAAYGPAPVPPHMIPGAQYGLPITGTPIGLPGPPHIPHGVPAGLQRHTMKNYTRMHLPPPSPTMNISVKQRPGFNYPNPVNHVRIDEVQRAPFKLFHGTVPGPLQSLKGRLQARHATADDCE